MTSSLSARAVALISKSSEQWLHQFTSSPVVHAKSGVKIHLLGSSLLSHASTATETRARLSAMRPVFAGIDADPSLLSPESGAASVHLQRYSLLLDSSEFATTDGIAWFQQHKQELSPLIPVPLLDAAVETGLVPFAAEAAFLSCHSLNTVEALQHKDLVEAEAVARRAAAVRRESVHSITVPNNATPSISTGETQEEMIPSSSPQSSNPSLNDNEAVADADLRARLASLFESYSLPESLLASLKTARSSIVNNDIQALIMGPTLTREVSIELRHWMADHASAQTRFGVFDMIRKWAPEFLANGYINSLIPIQITYRAKVDTIVGKLGVLCIKAVAQGHSDRPIVAIVERKLVADVADAFDVLNRTKK
ncbi:hypothetical protein BC830DRAFT_1164831 [Chytriomyces sp. MP71]|nr:hypothetical protein BC830DRAFT_1164831 [Chytriomyces sp. MP71]